MMMFVGAVGIGGFIAWHMILIGAILHDLARHAPRPQPPHPAAQVARGMTAGGVPFIVGAARG